MLNSPYVILALLVILAILLILLVLIRSFRWSLEFKAGHDPRGASQEVKSERLAKMGILLTLLGMGLSVYLSR